MGTVNIDLSAVHSHLNQVINAVETVNSNVAAVRGEVQEVAQQQAQTRNRLEQLYDEFSSFVEADVKHKAMQFAQTRIIEVRQEIEKKFGHFDVVRRTTVGILQATDVAIVREETMRTAGEQLMLQAPGYWLAPALVALTAWIGDNRQLAERAMNEAIRRDDSKTSLFFALVCRRARRMTAVSKWLLRYFQIQNPHSMDREVVVMIDALANGVFGGAALTTCSSVIEQWLVELEQQAGFVEEQRKRWAERIDVMTPRVGEQEYPTLRKYSATWPSLAASLAAARRHEVVFHFFENMFAGEIIVPPSLEAAVNARLDSLVTNYDEQELPLRREDRRLQLIVEEQGDKVLADRRMDAEKEALEGKTNFAAMLTSSAMSPEQFGATKATQRYAVARCRSWILGAHQDLVGRDRARVPAQVEIACGSWKGTSRNGSEETPLADNLIQHYAARIEEAVNAVKITGASWAVLIAGIVFGLLFMLGGGAGILFGLLLIVAGGGFFYYQYTQLDKRRDEVRQALEKERNEAARILKAALAELVDLRREIAAKDAKSEKVTEFLQALSSAQFVLQAPDQSRATVA